jgi:hypothetical protein
MITTVSPFAPMDYVRALEAAGVAPPWIPDPLKHGRNYAAAGPSYTIRIDGAIAAVLGLMINWETSTHRATAWAVWTPTGYAHPYTVHRLTKRYLRRLIQQYRIVRLDAEIVADFDAAGNWLEHLGLWPEGPPRLYAGPQGEAMQSFGWVHPKAAPLMLRRPLPAPVERVRRPDGTMMPAISGAYDGGATLYIMIALSVAAAAASAYTTYQAGQAQKAGHEYNAKVAENQAQIAAQQAEYARQQQAARDRKVQAAARAAQGVSGIETGEGSSLLIDIENARQAALNAEATRYTEEARQRGMAGQAGLERWQGRQASQQATIGAGASLLGGVASAGRQAYSPTPTTVRVPASTGSSGDIDLGYY